MLAAVALVGATGFTGTAKQLVPTAGDLGAIKQDSSNAMPSSNWGPGYKSSWTAAYHKASGEKVSVDVIVWTNTASAQSFFRNMCGNCTTPQKLSIGTLEFGRYGTGLAAYGTCKNVIVVSTATGKQAQTQLAHDAGFGAGWVLGRAFRTHC
jgi:hypothetical protein